MHVGWRFGLALAMACGSAVPPAAPVNRAEPERETPTATTLTVYVDDVREHCAQRAREHVEVTIDGRAVGSIEVICYGAMKVSAQTRQFRLRDAPVVDEGIHRIVVRHVESGRAATKELQFPAGRPDDRRQPWIMLDKLPITLDHTTLVIGDLRM